MNRTPVKMVARVLFPSGQANQEFEGTEEEVCFQALMAHINKQGIATAPDTERQIQQYIHEVLSANERSEFVSYGPLCINAPGQQIKISVRGSTGRGGYGSTLQSRHGASSMAGRIQAVELCST